MTDIEKSVLEHKDLATRPGLDPETRACRLDELTELERCQSVETKLDAATGPDGRLRRRVEGWPAKYPANLARDALNKTYHQTILNGSFPRHSYILSRDGDEMGLVTNPRAYPCRMEGCTGMRISVLWPDGRRTYPCSKGLHRVSPHVDQIG